MTFRDSFFAKIFNCLELLQCERWMNGVVNWIVVQEDLLAGSTIMWRSFETRFVFTGGYICYGCVIVEWY